MPVTISAHALRPLCAPDISNRRCLHRSSVMDLVCQRATHATVLPINHEAGTS
jgi:hypothetical protein